MMEVFQALANITPTTSDSSDFQKKKFQFQWTHLSSGTSSSPETQPELINEPSPAIVDTILIDWNIPTEEVSGVKQAYAEMTPISKPEIVNQTQNDQKLQLLTKWIMGEEDNSKDHPALFEWFLARQQRLAVVDGIVYICDTPTKAKSDFQTEEARILLPTSLQPRAVSLAHEHPLNGHRGVMATYRSIAKQYSWKGLFSDILRFCKHCDNCQSRRAPRGEYPTLTSPIIVL